MINKRKECCRDSEVADDLVAKTEWVDNEDSRIKKHAQPSKIDSDLTRSSWEEVWRLNIKLSPRNEHEKKIIE